MHTILRISMFLVLMAAPVVAADLSWVDLSSTPTSPSLDNPIDPIYNLDAGYVTSSELEGYGSTRLLELDGRWRDLFYFRDIFAGDIDIGAIFDATIFAGSADVHLPNQVVRMACDAGWTWRYIDGDALQLRIAPGLYSDIGEMNSDVFFMPVSLAYFKSFSSDLGGVLGVQIRPEFERTFFPMVGIDWDACDYVRLSLLLPESKLIVYFNSQWSAHLGYEWSNMSYALREKGSYNRKMITYEDSRYTFGVTYKLSDQMQLTGVIGKSFDRSIEFEHEDGGIPRVIDMETGTYVRFGIGGPF